jgi:hypothetical protein
MFWILWGIGAMGDWNCQEAYLQEASERSSGVCLPTGDDMDDDTRLIVENAYRRGYCQGFYAAIDAPNSSKPSLDEFYSDELHRWRYEVHNGQFTEPPKYW